MRRVSKRAARVGYDATAEVWPSIIPAWKTWIAFLGSAICDKADDNLDKVANLFTDDDGWGAVIFEPGAGIVILGERWNENEKKLHINTKETLAVKRALERYRPPEPFSYHLFIDNTSAWHGWKRAG